MGLALPSVEHGYLPYFLLYAGVASILHSIVGYLCTPETALIQFRGPSAPLPSSLLAHVYSVKNIYTGVIRLYAAYHMDNEPLYHLAAFTFAGVLFLYGLERFKYRTVANNEVAIPLVTSSLGLVWMILGRSYYSS